MQKYRRKPIIIEAVQLNNLSQKVDGICNSCWQLHNYPHIHIGGGLISVPLGNWIIKGANGEVFCYKPELFEIEYEKVEE